MSSFDGFDVALLAVALAAAAPLVYRTVRRLRAVRERRRLVAEMVKMRVLCSITLMNAHARGESWAEQAAAMRRSSNIRGGTKAQEEFAQRLLEDCALAAGVYLDEVAQARKERAEVAP